MYWQMEFSFISLNIFYMQTYIYYNCNINMILSGKIYHIQYLWKLVGVKNM